MAEIDYYLFPLSPFSYLAGLGLEKVAARHGRDIAYKPVQLFRIFAEVGTPQIKDRHPSQRSYRLQDLARLARAKALPINLRPRHWPTNPMPASAAIVTAQARRRRRRARWCTASCARSGPRSATSPRTRRSRDVLAAAGFDPALADRGLLTAVETVERNTDEALRRGVFGAPSYLVGDEIFWGQDRLPLLDAHLEAAG